MIYTFPTKTTLKHTDTLQSIPYKEVNIRQVGSKAYHLTQLWQKDYMVPPFVVLTTEFFFQFLGEQKEEYQTLLANYSDSSLDTIRKLIDSRPFSVELQKTLMDTMVSFFGLKQGESFPQNTSQLKLAVRSSATDEDGEKHSFAGMMESYLNISPSEDIFPYIKKCYLSCFSDRVMTYRKNNGLIHSEIGMAVILQEMIEAEYSGVMFTSNPQTNNPDQVFISLIQGLGEDLVSGKVDSFDAIVDTFGEISDVSTDMPLSTMQLKKLASIGLSIEDLSAQKRACDIEFCIKENQIYILQNRLITTYRHIDKNMFRTILDNSNIIESYSGVTTPLTFSFAREVYEKIYRQTLHTFYISKEDIDSIKEDLQQMIVFYENKIYYRLNSWYKMTSLYPGYTKNKKYMEKMMGVKIALKESKSKEKFRLCKIYLRFLYKLLKMPKDSATFLQKFEQVTKPYFNNPLENYSNMELLEIYHQLESSILDDFIVPITNDMGAMVFMGILSEQLKKKSISDSDGMMGKLLSKQGNVESVKQSLALIEIVDTIWKNPDLLQEFRNKSVDQLAAQIKDGRAINQSILRYIDMYGARSMDELKLETITLHQDVRFIFQTIKNYIHMDKQVEVYQGPVFDEGELYQYFSFFEKIWLKRLVKICKYFVKNRELLRLRRTYIYSIVRNIFLRIGHNLEKQGVLSSYRDIFYLTKNEIFHIIKKQPQDIPSYQHTIFTRKREYEDNRQKPIYERMYFYGEMTPENMIPIFTPQEIQNGKDGKLYGVAGGGQVVTGIVKYVTDPADANVDGYILMANRTDPGWTVLFPMARAIIIERGSILSHSAVIAREMGITLVVGIRGLTDAVKDGMQVRVDGTEGSVEIIGAEDENKTK